MLRSHVETSGAFCLRQNAQRAALRAAGQATSGKVFGDRARRARRALVRAKRPDRVVGLQPTVIASRVDVRRPSKIEGQAMSNVSVMSGKCTVPMLLLWSGPFSRARKKKGPKTWAYRQQVYMTSEYRATITNKYNNDK